MKKERNIKVKINSEHPRSLVYTAYPLGIPMQFVVYYNVKNPKVKIQYNGNLDIVKNGEIQVDLFSNLSNSLFCNTFFELDTVRNQSLDFINKFIRTAEGSNDIIFKFMDEKYDIDNFKKNKQNSINITGWRLFSFEEDLLFFFIQRKVFNTKTKLNVIRTCGLQYSTSKGIEALGEIDELMKNKIKTVKKTDTPDFLLDYEADFNE